VASSNLSLTIVDEAARRHITSRPRPVARRCKSAPLIRRISSATFAETTGNAWTRFRAGAFLPRDGAPGESCVAVLRCHRIEKHDADTIAVVTFRSATTDLLRAACGSVAEHSHADQYTNGHHPTHRHSSTSGRLGFETSDERKRRAIQGELRRSGQGDAAKSV
jgi:hypothetical protein